MQLHTYVRAQSITPQLGNSYTALAVNNETFDSVVGGNLVNIILACPIVAIVLVFIITVMLLVVYTNRDQWRKRRPLTISSKATLLSLTVINGSYASATLVFGINAISASRQQLYSIHGQGKVGEPYNILYNIPVLVFVFDLLATLPIDAFAVKPVIAYINGSINDITDKRCYIYAISTSIGVIISLLNHTPYMVIAYFVDPSYTTGALILYTIVVVSWFTLLEFLFDSSLRNPQNGRSNVRRRNCKHVCAHSTVFFVLFISYLGLAYVIFLYLDEIPIKPVFIAMGGFVVYKLVSRRKLLWNWQSTVGHETQQLVMDEQITSESEDHRQNPEQQRLIISPQ